MHRKRCARVQRPNAAVPLPLLAGATFRAMARVVLCPPAPRQAAAFVLKMFVIPAGVGVFLHVGSERKVSSPGGHLFQQLAWGGHGHSEPKQDQEVGLGQALSPTSSEKDHGGKKFKQLCCAPGSRECSRGLPGDLRTGLSFRG